VNGHGAQRIKGKIIDSASHVLRKAVRQTEQRNEVEQ
jgi:hypothetical protein